jgi:hypothetical protein
MEWESAGDGKGREENSISIIIFGEFRKAEPRQDFGMEC